MYSLSLAHSFHTIMTNKILCFILLNISVSQLCFSQCPEAEQYVQKVKQADNWTPTERAKSGNKIQGWTQFGAWHAYKCECEAGNLSARDAERLKDHLNTIRGIIQSRYSKYGTVPPVVNKCNSSDQKSGGAVSRGEDKFNFVDDDLINADARRLVEDLAANSDDPNLKEFASKLNGISGVQNDVNSFRNLFNVTPSQKDLQFDKVMTNTAQVIAAGQFIVKLFQKKKEQKTELTPDQKMAQSFMWDMRNKIRLIYAEARVIPAFSLYDQDAINDIGKLERSYHAYDIATAAERCTIIKFFWSNKRYGYSEILNFYNEVQSWSKKEQLKYIDRWQGYADYDHALYLANSEESFKVNRAILLSKKARYYKNMGEDEEAEKLLAMVDLNLDATQAITLMQNAFIDSDFELASLYYPIIKNKFESEETPLSHYSFDTGQPLITGSNATAMAFVQKKGTSNSATKSIYLSRNDVIMLLASGTIISIYNGDVTSANQELDFLKSYIRKRPASDLYKDEDHAIALSILEGIKSAKLLKANYPEEALVQIENTLALKSHTELLGTKYTLWLKQIYFDILVANKRYDEAHELYVAIKMNPLVANPEHSLFFDPDALMFKKCELLYAQGAYQRVLNGLDLLETIKPNPKYNLMRSKVYHAMAEYDKSREELTKI